MFLGLLVHNNEKEKYATGGRTPIKGDFRAVDKLRANKYGRPSRFAANGFIPNFVDPKTELSKLIYQFVESGRRFPEVAGMDISQNEQLRSRIDQIRLENSLADRSRLTLSLASDIEQQIGASTLISLLPSISSTVKSNLPPSDPFSSS